MLPSSSLMTSWTSWGWRRLRSPVVRWGGTWALWYALARPERVRRLMLLTGAPLLPGTRSAAPVRVMAAPVVGDLLAGVVKPNAKMVVRLMSAMGEGDTIDRYPELIESMVAAGRPDRRGREPGRASGRHLSLRVPTFDAGTPGGAAPADRPDLDGLG